MVEHSKGAAIAFALISPRGGTYIDYSSSMATWPVVGQCTRVAHRPWLPQLRKDAPTRTRGPSWKNRSQLARGSHRQDNWYVRLHSSSLTALCSTFSSSSYQPPPLFSA